MTDKPRKSRQVEIVKANYQPSAAELTKEVWVNATFKEAVIR